MQLNFFQHSNYSLSFSLAFHLVSNQAIFHFPALQMIDTHKNWIVDFLAKSQRKELMKNKQGRTIKHTYLSKTILPTKFRQTLKKNERNSN